MQATNINEVIDCLESVIRQTYKDGNPMGYFAALYQQVTITIKDGIACNYYEDCKRMEQLDVIFANRYLQAYTQYATKQACTESWRYAFDTAGKRWPTVMQDLLLGINAHINLDLAIAAEETCPGGGLPALKGDFDKINDVLASLVGEVEKDLSAIWPRLKKLLLYFGKCSSFMIDFSIGEARKGAWKFATELAQLDVEQKKAAILDRDQKIHCIALMISKPGFFISTLFLVIRIGEIGSVAKKIEALRQKKIQPGQ